MLNIVKVDIIIILIYIWICQIRKIFMLMSMYSKYKFYYKKTIKNIGALGVIFCRTTSSSALIYYYFHANDNNYNMVISFLQSHVSENNTISKLI